MAVCAHCFQEVLKVAVTPKNWKVLYLLQYVWLAKLLYNIIAISQGEQIRCCLRGGNEKQMCLLSWHQFRVGEVNRL